MNNIEKLAKTHCIGTYQNSEDGERFYFRLQDLEAFAKALQSSEPVAYIDTKMFNSPHLLVNGKCVDPLEWVRSFEKSTNIFTHPPVQSSEPVAVCSQESFGRGQVFWFKEQPADGTKLFTHPPATASLEKYNKLLEILKQAKIVIDITWNSSHANRCDAVLDAIRQAIAEAEGKEG